MHVSSDGYSLIKSRFILSLVQLVSHMLCNTYIHTNCSTQIPAERIQVCMITYRSGTDNMREGSIVAAWTSVYMYMCVSLWTVCLYCRQLHCHNCRQRGQVVTTCTSHTAAKSAVMGVAPIHNVFPVVP